MGGATPRHRVLDQRRKQSEKAVDSTPVDSFLYYFCLYILLWVTTLTHLNNGLLGKYRKYKLFSEWSEEPLIGKNSFPIADKTLTKFNFGKKEKENVCMAYSLIYWEIIRVGIQAVSQRLKLKQRMLYWVVFHDSFSLISHTSHDHLDRDGAVQNNLVPNNNH